MIKDSPIILYIMVIREAIEIQREEVGCSGSNNINQEAEQCISTDMWRPLLKKIVTSKNPRKRSAVQPITTWYTAWYGQKRGNIENYLRQYLTSLSKSSYAPPVCQSMPNLVQSVEPVKSVGWDPLWGGTFSTYFFTY